MKPTWIIQDNLFNEIAHSRLIAALDEQSLPHEPIKIIPFTDEPPNVPTDRPTVFYGTTTLIKSVYKAKMWNPGVWFEPENFRTSTWLKHYGKALLNHDAEVLPLFEVSGRSLPKAFFMKPDNDLKDFSGDIFTPAEFDKWYQNVSGENNPFDTDIPVVFSTPKYLGKEWRLVVVGGKVVAGSSYRLRSMRLLKSEMRPDVVELVERAAAIWTPAPVFVMDVCESEDGLKILELNCFNGSGLYECDVSEVVRAITSMLESGVQ